MDKIETELLLTDEFTQFSDVIKEVHATKKKMNEEFKKQFEAHKVALAALDKKAQEANDKWTVFAQSKIPKAAK